MTFDFTLNRNDEDLAVVVECSMADYAGACGMPAEASGRYAGAVEVEILSVTDEATGAQITLTRAERDEITAYAAENS